MTVSETGPTLANLSTLEAQELQRHMGKQMHQLLLTLHRAADSMFWHQKLGPQTHFSVPRSGICTAGQAPIFYKMTEKVEESLRIFCEGRVSA